MEIISRQAFDTRDDFKEWLEGLNFTVEYYGGTSGIEYTRIKYNLDTSETWKEIPTSPFISNNLNIYVCAIRLYNNGILISNGLTMDSWFYAAIAPENDGDPWVCQTSWADDRGDNRNLRGDLLVSRNIPNSGLSLSYDSIKLEQYYNPSTEEITPNKYYLITMPYRNLQWLYSYSTIGGGTAYERLSDHVPFFGHLSFDVGQVVEVVINEKRFLLIISGTLNDYLNDYEDDVTNIHHKTYYGAKRSVALRLP